jgi:hypothetical protein
LAGGAKHAHLALKVHGLKKRLVAVSQIRTHPNRWLGDRAARPLAVRQMNRGKSLVFGRWLRKHGVSQVKVAMKDLIVALFAPQAIAIYPNKIHKLAEYCYKF